MDEKKIAALWKTVRCEREIYHTVFNSAADPQLLGALPAGTLIEYCTQRLRKAELAHAIALRIDDVRACARCGNEGIREEDEKPGDDDYFEIHREQTDWESNYHKQWLCDECITADDNQITARNDKANRAGGF